MIILHPGDNISDIVANSAEGTEFTFSAGTYYNVSFTPKDGQVFHGGAGVILDGGTQVQDWAASGSSTWSADIGALSQQGGVSAEPWRAMTMPDAQDLFVDGKLQTRVDSMAELKAGSWYYDATSHKAFLGSDPEGADIVLSTTKCAIMSSAANVQIDNITVQHYAPGAQAAAICLTGDNTVLTNVQAEWNHGVGLMIMGDDSAVVGGSYSNNGQLGISGYGANHLSISGVLVEANNYGGYVQAWEAGGMKFTNAVGIEITNSLVRDNHGDGIWFDINSVGAVVSNNVVVDNDRSGIEYEISYDAKILNNIVYGNGAGSAGTLGTPAQILINNSEGCVVEGNYVLCAATGGDGIFLTYYSQTYPATGLRGAFETKDNSVSGNTIVFAGATGSSGYLPFEDTAKGLGFPNSFADNVYVVTSADHAVMMWGWSSVSSAASVSASGTGSVTVAPTDYPEHVLVLEGGDWYAAYSALLGLTGGTEPQTPPSDPPVVTPEPQPETPVVTPDPQPETPVVPSLPQSNAPAPPITVVPPVAVPVMTGGSGNDVFRLGAAKSIAITDHGGHDTVTSSISRSLSGYAGIENLTLTGTAKITGIGNGLDNKIIGNAAANQLSGMDGNDTLNGNGGTDTLRGGNGKDTLFGEKGTVKLVGGAGNDVYVLGANSHAVVDDAGSGRDLITSTISRNLANYRGVDDLQLLGTASLRGDGNSAANRIVGNTGNNLLVGNAGNDTLLGGGGADKLYAGAGMDLLSGGSGRDTFVFRTAAEAGRGAARDVITDFSHGVDHIDLSAIGVHSAFHFSRHAGFTGHAMELHAVQAGNLTIIEGDTNGDRHADFQIALNGHLTIGGGDFIL